MNDYDSGTLTPTDNVEFTFTVQDADWDKIRETFGLEQPKFDIVYRTDKKWFMPEFHLKNATMSHFDKNEIDSYVFFDAGFNCESMERIFAHWYHKPFYWMWYSWQKVKREFRKWRNTRSL